MRQHVCSNGIVVRIGDGRTEVILNSGALVVGVPEGNEEQAATAAELGYGADAVRMVEDHDPLHALLADWLGLETFGLRVAAGEIPPSCELAFLEEDAVLAVQKFMVAAGGRIPGKWSET